MIIAPQTVHQVRQLLARKLAVANKYQCSGDDG